MARPHHVIPNPRSAQPREVRQTWIRRRYWAEVRRNLLFLLLVLGIAGAGALAWMQRAPDAASPVAKVHKGNALNLR